MLAFLFLQSQIIHPPFPISRESKITLKVSFCPRVSVLFLIMIWNETTDLGSVSASRSEIHATDNDIGAAELYLHETVLRTSLGGAAAPPWLEVFFNTLNDIQQTVKHTSAVIENMRIAKSNVDLAKRTGSTSYIAKQKEVCLIQMQTNLQVRVHSLLARLTGTAQTWLTPLLMLIKIR
jgi:hypothetical protein